MQADSSGPTALGMQQRIAELEDCLKRRGCANFPVCSQRPLDPDCYVCVVLESTDEDTAWKVLFDYFQNDREGWKRGWLTWACRAKAVLGIESPRGQARR